MEKEEKRVQVGSLLSESVYRQVKAQAALEGRRVGEVIDAAIVLYLESKRKKKDE